MKTIQVNIYQFSELNDKAKERAKRDYAGHFGYNWTTEALASLKALAEHFGGSVKDYSVDFFNCSPSSAKFDMPEMEREEIGQRLAKLGAYNPETLRGNGDCKLTGCCSDEDAIDGFRAAYMAGESDLTALMQSAFKSWLKACQEDCESQYGDTEFAEHCDANEYSFYDNGEFVSKS